MNKLYYSAGACSMACEMALNEMGIKHDAILIDWDTQNADLAELNRLNPLGAAPVLVTENNKSLTQNTAIMEYFADLNPNTKMLPAAGTWERAQVLSWLSFAASDFHKSFVPLFALSGISQNETTKNEVKTWATAMVNENLAHLDKNLAGKDFICGSQYTIADSYLFVVSGWTKFVGIPTDSYKNLTNYLARIYQRPATQLTLKNAGLLN